MIEQAAGLALLAALSPTALLVAAVYLGSARPRLTALFHLADAVIMSVIMAVAVLAALQVIATARADIELTAAAVAVVVVINVLLVWLPLVLFLLAPGLAAHG